MARRGLNGYSLWLLAAILALAAFLRLQGIDWGLPTAGVPHAPYHPDETWAMSVLRQLDPGHFGLNPVDAHREGTLAYYLWMFAALGLRAVGAISSPLPTIVEYGVEYRRVLLAGRVVTAMLDLGSIALLFLGLRKVTGGLIAPVLGALALAIAPFEVIYAHYMRTHIVANFFLTLVIFLSLDLAQDDLSNRRLTAVGLTCGFATATKYTAGVVALVPVMFLIARRLPYRDCLLAEFRWQALFDLSRVYVFLGYLIPYGTLPLLWVLFYASVAVAFVSRATRRISIPLALFLLLYLYPMAKGYFAAPIFIRASLQIFPVLAFLVGLAWNELESRHWRRAVPVALPVVAGIVGASVLYDIGYTRAMARGDARDQLHAFMMAESAVRPVTIGYYGGGHDYFLVRPALDAIPVDRVRTVTETNRLREGLVPELDFLVLTAFEPGNEMAVRSEIRSLEATGRYRFLRVFSNPIRAFGVTFDYPKNPHDLQYPLPKLYLLAFNKTPAALPAHVE